MTETSTAGALAAERERAYQAERIGRVGSWYLDTTSDELRVSPGLRELYGLPHRSTFGRSDSLLSAIHDDDRATVTDALETLMTEGRTMDVRFRVHRASNGAVRWLHCRGERDPANPVGITGIVADFTDVMAAEMDARLAHAEVLRAIAEQQAIIGATPDAMHLWAPASGTFTRAATSGKPFSGFTEEEVRVMSGTDVHTLVPKQDLLELEALFDTAADLPDGEVVSMRHRVRHGDGSYRWLSRRLTPLSRDPQGQVDRVLVVSRDVSESVAGRHRLEHAAQHDDLTGVGNRRLFRDRLRDGLPGANDGRCMVVLVCDLDGFKRINDLHGHQVGDTVLVEIANRLIRSTRGTDTVARLGGDEFAIIMDIERGDDAVEAARAVGDRVLSAVAEPLFAAGHEHAVSVSVGIRIADCEDDAETVLNDADAAMYFVKRHGANDLSFYDPSHRPDAAATDRMERIIRRALGEESIEVHYQPVVDPRRGQVVGVEALLRVRDDLTGAYANTAKLVEVAERTGHIAALDEQVLLLACRQVAAWRRDPELATLVLKVNRSATEISRPGLLARVTAALESTRLDPTALTLELTETVLLDATTETLADLRALNDLGVGLAIDDFGTGYASLRYLAELPVTCIKIDRSFVVELPHDPTALTLVRATVGLAEQLGIVCVVEGVETTTQLEALPAYEKLLIQGYLYGRPQPADSPPAVQSVAGTNPDVSNAA